MMVNTAPAKMKGSITSMFGVIQTSIRKNLDFINITAPATSPSGYFDLVERIGVLRTDMNAAADIEDFCFAEEEKVQCEKLLTVAVLEKKLFWSGELCVTYGVT